MELKEISIEIGMTHNLGDYSNFRPELRLTARLGPGDDFDTAVDVLRSTAMLKVHDTIDDELEARDQAPYYYDGPRFDLLRFSGARIAVIAPVGLRDALPGLWASNAYTMAGERRLEIVRQKATDLSDDWTVYDCSDGNYRRLPELERFAYWVVDEPETIEGRYLLLTPDAVDRDDLPESWQGWYVRRWTKTNTRAVFVADMETRAASEGLTLLPGFTPEDRAALPVLKLTAEAMVEGDLPDLEYQGEYEDDYDE